MGLTLRRELPYPVPVLRTALTDPAALAAWFWPAHAEDRLAFTWRWDGEELVTNVDIALSPFTLTHAGFPDGARRDDHVRGWSDCLDRLSVWLRERSPEP